MGCIAVPVALAAVLIFTPVALVSSFINGARGLFNLSPMPASASVIDTPSIINSVLPLGQLVTVNAQLAKADIRVVVRGGMLNSCSFNADHVAVGAVEAGVDLSQLDNSAAHYDETTETYYLTLPVPHLTSCRIEFIRQYNRSFTTCPVDWDEARLLANYTALDDFRNTAIEGGILERAEREARIVMESFVRALTQKNVVVMFARNGTQLDATNEPMDTRATNLPPSCVPQAPQGWLYIEQDRAWRKVN
ncbi:MAG: hypothetical protein BroJett033_8730 [Chloroflexota bacterium]|nr:MAG: hypothetical protein BroJett033_8730 [Chloroflexota bacterium]